ncbi:MAG: polysaccharide biosynthesis/export family protein [Myxococcota bacterium]
MRHLLLTVPVFVASLAAACSSLPPAEEVADPAPTGPYRLGPRDVIEVSVWRNDKLGRTVPVRPDGKISLPLVNDVQAAGLTPDELRDRLVNRFSKFVEDPEVAVIVREVHSSKVAVYGEVAEPGRYALEGPTRLLGLLAQAGGPTEFASRSRVVLIREGEEGPQRMQIAYDHLVDGEDGSNPWLRPGDTVVVP